MQKINAVLFDLDGTLIDSESYYYAGWQPILKENYNLDITFNDWLDYFAGHTFLANIEVLKNHYGLSVDEHFMDKAVADYYALTSMTRLGLMPFAEEALAHFKALGTRIGLVTSSYRSTVDTVLGGYGLLDNFEFFVTREKVFYAKPNPEPYLLATDLLQLPKEEIIVVEDTITGATAAKAAGLYCYGISQHAVERERLVKKVDQLYFSLAELIAATVTA
ncbi:HAD family hydrolase [Sphingobacterium sp. Mn56C]|uniref:HAD family hydrolase n=1 Tax=Sphingobacterium sp. Mn56C TaxID=3395261 RepID=UPI003BDD368B